MKGSSGGFPLISQEEKASCWHWWRCRGLAGLRLRPLYHLWVKVMMAWPSPAPAPPDTRLRTYFPVCGTQGVLSTHTHTTHTRPRIRPATPCLAAAVGGKYMLMPRAANIFFQLSIFAAFCNAAELQLELPLELEVCGKTKRFDFLIATCLPFCDASVAAADFR